MSEATSSAPIIKSHGSTPSERILADLGDQTFLKLWSYPNLFIDKKRNGKGDGKELCDLLVVCGDDVLIFSDKHIAWQNGKPIDIAWPRFYKRAIEASADQIKGAARWIDEYPDRVFIDKPCTQRLPLTFPPAEQRQVHGIVIAGGAHTACQDYFNDDSGSFFIQPDLQGLDHISALTPGHLPFSIGDINPGGMFIHVFDDVTIKRLLEHLDTITDFTSYLNKRVDYVRSGKLLMAHGEEELLASYLNVGITTGEYDFEMQRKKKFKDHKRATVQGEWSAYLFSEARFAKELADKDSRVWDNIINVFATPIMDGTSVEIAGEKPVFQTAEVAVRFLALENRFSRRILGEAVKDALNAASSEPHQRFTRIIMPSKSSANPRLLYILMILAYPTDLEERGGLPEGYEQYRRARVAMLHGYCLSALHKYRNYDTAVGIAIDASSKQTGRQGGSEDLMAIKVDEWTPDLEARVAADKEDFEILQDDRLRVHNASRFEFPVDEK